MESSEIETIEIDLLLEAIHRRYGHDFRGYARAHLERRLRHACAAFRFSSISELIPAILHEEPLFEKLVLSLSITVTEMFRDPPIYKSLREKVVPILRTFPFTKVWVAGCSTGEEAYSMAILLREEGLYERATVFATDFNDSSLQKARDGIYDLELIQRFTRNYQDSGGNESFSEYYHAGYGFAALDPSLRTNIVFANHNLVTDGIFGEMNMIICRNVLIYFDQPLQDRVLALFCDSLALSGILCIGSNEEIQFSSARDRFRTIDHKARIYQKVAGHERGDRGFRMTGRSDK